MQLSTPVLIDPCTDKIKANHHILTIGSCFSDHIGKKLQNSLFQSLINPFGTVFNPFSICHLLEMSDVPKRVSSQEIDTYQDRYFHHDYHSTFTSKTAKLTTEKINSSNEKYHSFFQKTDWLILTLGTSIVYKKRNGTIVANCHKVPSKEFNRSILSVGAMTDMLSQTFTKLQNKNPRLKIILTVSPVRHTKEGLTDNQLSKSRLIDVAYTVSQKINNIYYFPAYEIMMDELRDYRFYRSDLIHPSAMAVEIIWKRFAHAYFSEDALDLKTKALKINNAIQHKPFDETSPAHQKFLQKLIIQIDELSKTYPHINLESKRTSILEKCIN